MKSSSRKAMLATAVLGPVVVAVYLAAAVFFLPQLLIFPHHRQVDGVTVYSESAIPHAAADVLAKSDALLSASTLFQSDDTFPPIFFTDGGWRWKLLSLGAGGAFGLTRPSTEKIIVNRSDFGADVVHRRSTLASQRSLSAVIAHERTHTLIRRRFGLFADSVYPAWVREGYCDYVAGSSTLSDRQARALRAAHPDLSALKYYDARRRVAAILGSNGGSVRDLFTGSIRPR